MGGALFAQVPVKNGGAAETSLRQERVVGDITDGDPAETFVEAGAIAAGDGVKDEEGFAGGAGGGFGGAEEGGTDTLAAHSAMNEHFGEVGAVRLVFGEVEDELNGAANAVGIFGNEEEALFPGDIGCDFAPERKAALARKRVHEADGGAAFDAIDEEIGKLVQLRFADVMELADGAGGRVHGLSAGFRM